MGLFGFVKKIFAPREPDDEAAIRNSKLAKEMGDCAFRIAQMWIVVSLVKVFYDASQHWAAGTVYFFLVVVLTLYSLLAPRQFVLEWEQGNGRKDRPISWFGALLIVTWLAYAAAPLLYVNEVTAIIHDATIR